MQISDISKIITNKVNGFELSNENYISTENMLPNCGGITTSSSVPTTKVTAFLKEDILLSNIRPYFKKVWFARFGGGCSNDVICLRVDKEQCLPEYLYYVLSTDKFIDSFSASSKGTKMPRGDKNALLSYDFPERSIEEQQHIVDILGSIDEKIENNEKIIANIEKLCKKEYQKLSADSSRFLPLGDIIKIFDSQRIPLSSRERDDKKGDYPYYGATGVLDYVDDYIFSGEYVLIAEDGTVIDEKGYPIVQLVIGDFWVNNHAHILQAKNDYTNYSLYIALKCTNVSKAVTGAVQLKINQANLCKIELPSIDSISLSTFNNMIQPLFGKMLHLQKENEKLNELKQLYLKKFFG